MLPDSNISHDAAKPSTRFWSLNILSITQFLRLTTVVQLSGTHRVAARDAAVDDRAGHAAGTGDGTVDPGIASGVERRSKPGHGNGPATRGPPMRHRKFASIGRTTADQRRRRKQFGGQSHDLLRPDSRSLQVFRSGFSFIWQGILQGRITA